jgi:hypothetical protein
LPSIAESVLHELEQLSARDQQRALEFVRGVSRRPQGTPIHKLIDLAGTLDDQSAAEMRQAIEEGCEQIDAEEWS